MGGRRIDILTISIGINDIGFAQAIAAWLINGGVCGEHFSVANIESAVETGNWSSMEDREGRCIGAAEWASTWRGFPVQAQIPPSSLGVDSIRLLGCGGKE